MEEYEKKKTETLNKGSLGGPPEPPALSSEFFAQLLNLPACKAKGRCNNCGRCER